MLLNILPPSSVSFVLSLWTTAGHKNIRVFVSHSGIFGTLEAVYHGVPIVTMPVFADQDSNAAKVVEEGYGLRLELKELSADGLVNTITRVANDPQYKTAVK